MDYGQNRTILVVDDEPAICELVRLLLSQRQLQVTTASDSQAARQLLEEAHFDTVLCDVRMPCPGGLELLDVCRRKSPQTPFILMTGQASIADVKAAIRNGAYDYLEKPFDSEALCNLVDQAASVGRARLQRSSRPASADVATSQPPACHDAVTGLLAPRAFFEQLSSIRLASLADRRICSLLMADVDEFSEANSMFGYGFGDEVLRSVAKCLTEAFDQDAAICRLGEDRFAVALTGVGEGDARARAELLREQFSHCRLFWQDHQVSLTMSIGVAETGPGFSVSEAELRDRAVQALKEAKRGGRNRVIAHGELVAGGGQWELVNNQLQKASDDAMNLNRQLRLACLEGVGALVSAVEAKDPYTRRHSEQVAYYAEQFGRALALPGDVIETIRVAAMMHDVGKIGIPDTVLTKPGKLTDEEFALIRDHPRMGANIVLKISMLRAEGRLIRHHHEQWDGSGYPDKLAGEQIPLGARVIQLADCIDAMLMRRVYKEPFPISRVLEELQKGRGTQFDPALADVAGKWIQDNPDKIIRPQDEGV
jgi:diguanylate cyclase (GGDEF)-like protein